MTNFKTDEIRVTSEVFPGGLRDKRRAGTPQAAGPETKIVLKLIIVIFFLLSCHTRDTTPKSSEKNDNSIYLLESIWTNQRGEKMQLSSFKGKPIVLTMAYTSCEYSCPRIVAEMKRIEAELSHKDVGFVFVSFDPQRDTPQKLRIYAAAHHLDEKKWTLLHGDASSIQELAAVLGIQYKKLDNGDYAHSNIITSLNREGEIDSQR